MNALVDIAPLALAGVLFLAALGAGILAYLQGRVDPVVRERRRRLAVNSHGRTTEASITEFRDCSLYYSYTVRGVQYAASQDVSTLRAFLPEDPALLAGPATLKYSAANPADSILVCEEWSGFQRSRAASS